MSTDQKELIIDWSDEHRRGDHLVAAAALRQYGFSDRVAHTMITLSENATYFVEDPETGRTGILRVHREDYHSQESIESELDWLTALHDSPVSTNVIIPAADGRRVVAAEVRGTTRYAVLFEVMSGLHPDEEALHVTDFETLGRITAHLHDHARGWTPPEGFSRFSWDWAHTLGDTPRWGRWQDSFGVGAQEEQVLGEAAELVRSRLESYGSGPERYGLVHADLRLANLLVQDDNVHVIDFDDCGYSWFMYDFGTAVSFIEDDPRVPEWQQAWVEGYRSVSTLSEEDEAMLPTFVMLRRLLLVAWMGSHSHTEEVRRIGPGFTTGAVELAQRFLRSGGTALT